MKQKYPVAVVHCTDQTFCSGTYDPRVDMKKFTLSEMIIAGHLIHKDSEKVILALEYFDDNDIRYVSIIPQTTISKLEVLREQDKD